MEYRHLGRSGLKISRLCLGTGNFGSSNEVDSFELMDYALDSGVNVLDTAVSYGSVRVRVRGSVRVISY